MMVISPTPGRIVWYYPDPNGAEGGFASSPPDQPLAAIVARVWDDSRVNLAVIDANGVSHPRKNVFLRQEGDEFPSGAYACWMPYQVGQAAKASQQVAVDAITAVAASSGHVDAGVFPAASLVLTDRDAAADLAGTARPDNPSIASGGGGDFGGAGATSSWNEGCAASSGSDSSSSSDSGSCSSSGSD